MWKLSIIDFILHKIIYLEKITRHALHTQTLHPLIYSIYPTSYLVRFDTRSFFCGKDMYKSRVFTKKAWSSRYSLFWGPSSAKQKTLSFARQVLLRPDNWHYNTHLKQTSGWGQTCGISAFTPGKCSLV